MRGHSFTNYSAASKVFFDLINKEYERRMACGGDGAVSLLIVMKNILEAELK